MAAGVRTTVVGAEALQRALQRARPEVGGKIAARLLRELALRTQSIAAREKIVRGGGGPPVRGRLTSRTGTGRRSISTNFSKLPHASEVGSDLAYMAAHEIGGTFSVPAHTVGSHTRTVAFGRSVAPFTVDSFRRGPYQARIPRRAWLEPAVDDVVRKAPDIAARIWEREI